jgi:hypothetical protein
MQASESKEECMLQIVEVKWRMRQGTTKPLLCVASDGHQYVVKDETVGKRGLIAEWLGANLGSGLRLPIPEFEILELKPEVNPFSSVPGIEALTKFPVFGSRFKEDAVQFCGGYSPN